jgi:hypothetical protein
MSKRDFEKKVIDLLNLPDGVRELQLNVHVDRLPTFTMTRYTGVEDFTAVETYEFLSDNWVQVERP